MNASIACEQCRTVCAADSVVFSSRGEQLCKACLAAAQIALGDELAVQSQRSARRSLVGGLALVVAVPVALVVTGNGRLLVTAFTVLGVLSGYVGYRMLRSFFFSHLGSRKPEHHIKTGGLIFLGAGLVLGVLAVVSHLLLG